MDDESDRAMWHDLCTGTSAATYEVMHARYRVALMRLRTGGRGGGGGNLLHQAISDQRIVHQNLSYVVAVLMASGFSMDKEARDLMATHRHHGRLLFDYTEKLTAHLKTSDTIKRTLVVSANAMTKLEEQQVMRKFPRADLNAYNNNMSPPQPTHYLLIIACSDTAIDRLASLVDGSGGDFGQAVLLDIVREFTTEVGKKSEKHYIYAVRGDYSQQFLVERAPLYYC